MNKLLKHACNFEAENIIIHQQNASMRKLITWIEQYYGYTFHKYDIQILKEWRFNKTRIDNFYKQHKKANTNIKKKLIIKLYEKYIIEKSKNDIKYACYQLIQHLVTISSNQFYEEFGIIDEEGIQQFIRLTFQPFVHNLEDFKMKTSIIKHIEKSQLSINFSKTFKLDEMCDQLLLNLFYNIENRIQLIGGLSFIIARKISNNQLTTCMLTGKSNEEVSQLIQNLNDGQLYDVILTSWNKIEQIGIIKMRYLNYMGNNFAITLSHPRELCSLTTEKVLISNINKCVNIENLCSYYNHFSKNDLHYLNKIKRIQSWEDNYKNNNSSFIDDIFNNNNLEYVFIENYYSNNNILTSKVLSQNSEKLRYLRLYEDDVKYQITLDVSTKFPKNLRVYDVETREHGTFEFGDIKGSQDEITQLKNTLIHHMKQNE